MEIDNLSLIDIYFNDIKKVLDSFSKQKIFIFYQHLLEAYHQEKHIFTMGNGGSASTASHFVCDINKGVSLNLNKRFKVISLNDNIATLLAYGNDCAYEDIFVEQLKNFLSPGDLVIAFSGSGNSANVLKAIEYANERDAKTFGLAGGNGGKLVKLCCDSLKVGTNDMQKIEDIHLMVCHLMMQMLCKELNPSYFAGNSEIMREEFQDRRK